MNALTSQDEPHCECVVCGQVKPQSLFGSYFSKGVRKYKRKCKDCLLAYQREYLSKKRAVRDAGKPPLRVYNEDGTIHSKRCNLCGEYKSLEEFASSPTSHDKKASACLPCDRERVRKWRADNTERSRASVRAYQAANREAVVERNRRWLANNADQRREWAREYRNRNRGRIRSHAAEWREKRAAELGLGDVRALYRAWYERYDGGVRKAKKYAETCMNVPAPEHIVAKVRQERKMARLAEWASRPGNIDRLRGYSRKWYWSDVEKARKLNRESVARRKPERVKRIAYLARMNQEKRGMRTPSWVSWPEIYKLRAEARRLTRVTGVKHEVDHIYPVCSPYVCGLNVHQNLRVIPATENRQKSNKLLRSLAHEHCVNNPTHLYPRTEHA